jgi:hypothetical protein
MTLGFILYKIRDLKLDLVTNLQINDSVVKIRPLL